MEEKKKTNVVAVIGFIVAIVSIFTFGFPSIIALVLSIIGLAIAKKYSKPLKGLAIAGLIISGISLILFWVLFIIYLNEPIVSNDFSSNNASTQTIKKKEKNITVPDFSTMTDSEAKTWCDTFDISCNISSDYNDEVEYGKLISQSVESNKVIKNTETIIVKYSLGHKKTPEEIAAEKKETFKASCQNFSYEEISRNPDNYKGQHAVFRGQVVQVLEESYTTTINLRVNVTEGSYGWWDDTIYVIYTLPEGSPRILEKDIVTIYGALDGLYSYTAVLGNTITIPKIDAEYIE